MLHIILAVLKILGILILILLAFILLMLLSLLFVPVTYRISGRKEGDLLEGKAMLRWLFGLISAAVSYEEGGPSIKIRILGISLDTLKKAGRKLKRRKSVKKAGENTGREEEGEDEENLQDPVMEDLLLREQEKGEKDSSPKNEIPQKPLSFFGRIREIIRKAVGIPASILRRIKKLQLTLQRFCDKISQWRKFLKDEDTKKAFQCLKVNGGGLLRHVMPRKVKGYVRFGFEDPAMTGQTLGAVSLILPLYKTGFQVIPVFDEKILEGNFLLKGRIFGCMVLKAVWNVYRSQPVKKTIRKFQHKEA
ncbi:MAG: DUF2953 domain-containing protein [Ruminococcus sp.]|jgi:hypothetical protein